MFFSNSFIGKISIPASITPEMKKAMCLTKRSCATKEYFPNCTSTATRFLTKSVWLYEEIASSPMPSMISFCWSSGRPATSRSTSASDVTQNGCLRCCQPALLNAPPMASFSATGEYSISPERPRSRDTLVRHASASATWMACLISRQSDLRCTDRNSLPFRWEYSSKMRISGLRWAAPGRRWAFPWGVSSMSRHAGLPLAAWRFRRILRRCRTRTHSADA